MNRKLYDILKAVALIWLPAAGTLVFALTDLWNLAYGAQIVGTIVAVDTFLGAGLRLTPRKYDGALVVDQTNPVKDVYSIEVGDELLNLGSKKEVRLEIKPAPDIHNVV